MSGPKRWNGAHGAVWGGRLTRAREMMAQDGPFALFAAVTREYVVDRREYYLYEHHHREWPAASFVPRLSEFEESIVATNEEADRLALNHRDLRPATRHARRGLDSGAVAFCIYVGTDLVHIGWLATSIPARAALDSLGYTVNFDAGQAWTGAAWTRPQFRRRGLLTYSCRRRFEYLLHCGFTTSRAAVETANLSSHRATMRFEPVIYGIGCQRRVLGWRTWTEREFVPDNQSHSPAGCPPLDPD